MKPGEVPFKLRDQVSQPRPKFVIRGEDDSAGSRLFRFFLFPGIVPEIGMRFSLFYRTILPFPLSPRPACRPLPSPPSRHTRLSWIVSKKSTRMAVLFVKGNAPARSSAAAYYPGHCNARSDAAATSPMSRRRGNGERGSEVTDDTRARFCHSEFIDGRSERERVRDWKNERKGGQPEKNGS